MLPPGGYAIERMGLIDAEHTRDDGYQYSEPHLNGIDSAGDVVGYSQRFIGSTLVGSSTWVYSRGITTRLGLFDAEHTRSDGYQQTQVWPRRSETDVICGGSSRYAGTTSLGSSSWVYSGGMTSRIGFFGADCTRSDGYQLSAIRGTNGNGQLVGYSYRYSGSEWLGAWAWIYSGGSTTRIGLMDAEHTGSEGSQTSLALMINEAGQVIGYSTRYGEVGELGRSAWVYSGGVATRIGLTGAEYTRSDNYQASDVEVLNQAGQVVGYSERYSGSGSLGRSAWICDGGQTIRIGLTDAEHTRADDYQRSIVLALITPVTNS